MDSFDEFEMKPITSGLGFHKKAIKLNEIDLGAPSDLSSAKADPVAFVAEEVHLEMPVSIPAQDVPAKPGTSYADFLDQLKTQKTTRPAATPPRTASPSTVFPTPMPAVPTTPPLPRPDMPGEPVVIRTPAENIKGKLNLDFVDKTLPAKEGLKPARLSLTPVSFSLQAAVLDSIVLVALTLLFLIAMLTATKLDVVAILMNTQGDSTTQISLAVMVMALSQLYMVLSRSFYGRTLGEWTFDLQLGNYMQHEMPRYPLQVAARSLVVMATGFVVLPVLSVLFGRDLAGALTGLQLYRQDG